MLDLLAALLNNALTVSILVILISSVVGFYVRSRSLDRCMRDFDGFTVTVEDKSGKAIWGTLRAYNSGIELLYSSEHLSPEGHVRNSYILYDSELANLQAVYRFHDDQSATNQLKRKRDIERTYQPSIFRRAARGLRNLFTTFRDAIVQSLNAVLGQRAAQRPENLMLSKYKDLTSSGAQFLGGVSGSAYEPILERYIGHYVALEILRGESVEEEYGILKEYSLKYIEMLNVKLEVPIHIYLKERTLKDIPVRIESQGSLCLVENGLDRTLIVESIRCQGEVRQVDVPVESGHRVDLELSDKEVGNPFELELSVRSLADLIVPRGVAVVRHAGKHEALDLEILLGLDDLPQLPWVKRLIRGRKPVRLEPDGPQASPSVPARKRVKLRDGTASGTACREVPDQQP
jgi:hypothetical protein